jgi:dihydrofolate reductase
MRKIVCFIACSLDGYIARTDHGIDWLFTDQDYGYTPFYVSVDTILMGRKTYDLTKQFGEYPYKGKQSYVFTKHSPARDPHVTFVSDISPFVHKLLAANGKDIWLVGGGEVLQFFLEHDLLDELVISIHPVLLGKGIPLFPVSRQQVQLKYVSSESFSSGLLQVRYRVVPTPRSNLN